MLAVAVSSLLLGGCTEPSEEHRTPTPAQTTAADRSPPLTRSTTASDGGDVEVLEVGFTVVADADPWPPAYAIWAAVLENTSQTDLLAFASLELAWTDGESTTEDVRHLGDQVPWVYDIRPGETAVIGGQVNIWDRLTPESLDVSVYAEWYPMWALEERGPSVGLEVTGFDIDTSRLDAGGRVGVRVDYTSWYESGPLLNLGEDDFRLLLVMRDAEGSLLGALQAAEFGVFAPGEFRQFGSVVASQWIDQADPDTSEAAITRVCCDEVW